MHVNKLPALALVGALTACVAPTPVVLSSHFNAAEVAWAKAKGTNEVSGQGFLRQGGGGVVTCAGAQVQLVPVATYSTERISGVYGNTTKGYIDPLFSRPLPAPDPGYVESWYKTQCDAQGKFAFSGLADGDYYLATRVVWYVGNSLQGGDLMQRVSLHGGEQKQVLLTNGG